MVGLAGFEPATSRPPDERATKLRYSPTTATAAVWWGVSGKQVRCKRESKLNIDAF
tara:strand:+ start:203 stop:370 length:168 start_codon:yes stop_codon:yes gene_type:complete